MFKGLWNYAIKAKDIEQTLQYYLNCLDAELLVSSDLLGCKYHLVRVGDTRIIIFDKAPYEQQLGITLPDGFLHAVYEVDDHDSHIEKLRKNGVKFIMEPTVIETDWDRRKIAFFEGPDSIRTEVMQILRTKKEM